MELIFGTFVYTIVSAIFPLLNSEAYFGILAVKADPALFLPLSIVGGIGQVIGKIPWYYAGNYSMKLPYMRKKMESEKWQRTYDRWHGRIAGRRWLGALLCFVSALAGLPPMAITAPLAGTLRINFGIYLATSIVGRSIQFALILAGVGVLFGV